MLSTNELYNFFNKKKVLITGGLGFLGSNLCRNLLLLGAEITLIDNCNPLYGGNMYNIHDIKEKVVVVFGNVADIAMITPIVLHSDLVFHLAGQVSHVDSINDPKKDLMLNSLPILEILEICRKYKHKPKILFASSWLVFGRSQKNPFNEESISNPITLYGIHKALSEKYFGFYYENFDIPYTIFRISNSYGPRQQIKHSKYSIVGWYIRRAMEDNTLIIFGDGKQIRNYIYVDDITEAMIRCAATGKAVGEIVNIGADISTPFLEMAETILSVVGRGRIEHVPWSITSRKHEPGDLVFSIEKLKRITGWHPSIYLNQGVYRTWEYYANNLTSYL